MKTYRGHELVEPGIYFNARQLNFKSMDDDGRLPGSEVDVWRRVPALALLVVGPVMGLAYAIFLPLIGFAMVGGALLRKAGELAVEAGHASGRVLRPAWQPARAFFSRRRKARGKAAPAKEGWLDDVKKRLRDDERSK